MSDKSTFSFAKPIGLAIVIGLCVNLGIAFFMDADTIYETLRKINIVVILVPFVSYFLVYFIDSLRLYMVLRQFGDRLTFGECFYNSVISILFSNITPFASGGQPFQIMHLTSIGIDSSRATNVVLSRYVEFLFTCFGIFLLSIPTALALINSMHIGREPLFIGFGVTIFSSFFILFSLIRPDMLSQVIIRLEHTRFGRLIGKLSRKDNWGELLSQWTKTLRTEVAFLWSEKLLVMLLDIFLGFLNLALQAFSLAYVLHRITPIHTSYVHIMITFVIINLVVYYVPTPGASGSIEGSYVWVFSGMNNNPAATTVAILIWRFATYYLHVFFGLLFFLLYRKGVGGRINREKTPPFSENISRYL
ncbi:MAG TPA: lysylphosphatidylglycerol synthase transmembrane domain-containing protein [Termitinemataceae bacterium]|nr:lysylphosphatidylglycerol synthase transmembrane domain-containing protein [Termitinemataceae bacterium]HOM24535.1 lysylphosphatidylglycerol synthase transmembrane domain-containing protein [Termitinemataceae bacterium]HPQ00232.1 lysylphosphatidylglycerol synthase transmembrane domain-containing protein [Termitinemataceae bacterium]